ncbi:MAG: acylphosphatase [Phycisphaerae bacterium]|nr:acylphosphatase [Phycisphaerae bacterium]MDD5380131.1 acylphosphatase [Phycisphaerae bacterium]
MDEIAKRIIFSGQVQGVGFRFTAFNIANRYELVGFVRNLPDGAVEMLAQGTAGAVDDCIRDIVEEFSGYIRETKAEETPPNPQYADFKITF